MSAGQKDSKPGARDGTFSSLLSAVRAQNGETTGLNKSGNSGPEGWTKPPAPGVPADSQKSRRGSLHPDGLQSAPLPREDKQPIKLPELDNQGRPFQLGLVVVNFANVGINYGTKFNKIKGSGSFNWEGVRKCVQELRQRRFKVIGVIYQNFKALDGDEIVHGIPEDIQSMCESIQETPRTIDRHQKSADDEMTIKCAYHRNCCILDNDNYKDWQRLLRKEEVREWYQFSRARIHMKYYFDTDMQKFETLDGNAERGGSEEREEKPRKSRNRRIVRTEEEVSRAPWSGPSGAPSGPSGPSDPSGPGTLCTTPPDGPDAPQSMFSDSSPAAASVLVPTETGFRKHKGPTITMPTSMTSSRSGPNTVDLTVEPARQSALKDINGLTAGWTALCTAAQQGKVQSVSRLLQAKADPNVPNCMGAHPLFYALCNWSLRMFRLLEKHGANIERARSEKGESLKAYAERKVGQAASMKRFGAAYFASASRQELLRAVGARKAARAALSALAASDTARTKRRRLDSRGRADGRVRGGQVRSAASAPSTSKSSNIPTHQDPYGGVNNSRSIDLTEVDWEDIDLPNEVADGDEAYPTPDGDEAGDTGEAGEAGDGVDDQELAALLGAALEEDPDEPVEHPAE